MPKALTFRIDDVSKNTDIDKLIKMLHIIHKHNKNHEIIIAISPLCFDRHDERAFPPELTACSDNNLYFQVSEMTDIERIKRKLSNTGIPIKYASHGAVHADHRLMHCQAQELSIVMGCALTESYTFVPPYHKWNQDTENICKKYDIVLVKFECGWCHLKLIDAVNNAPKNRIYFHTFDFNSLDEFERKF